MLRSYFIWTLLLIGQVAFGQEDRNAREKILYEKGRILEETVYADLDLDKTIRDGSAAEAAYAKQVKETMLTRALELYDELIDSFPSSYFSFLALGNKGFLVLDMGDTVSAKKIFTEILYNTANANSGTITKLPQGYDTYHNRKNSTAITMAAISINAKNWKEALVYLDLSKKYPFTHFCGNAHAAYDIQLAEMYAQCYLALSAHKHAYAVLVPHILDNSLADNSSLIRTAYSALLKTYSREKLKNSFEQAFKEIKQEKLQSGKDSYNFYFLQFLDWKIPVDLFGFNSVKAANSATGRSQPYTNSTFYKLLTNQERVIPISEK